MAEDTEDERRGIGEMKTKHKHALTDTVVIISAGMAAALVSYFKPSHNMAFIIGYVSGIAICVYFIRAQRKRG